MGQPRLLCCRRSASASVPVPVQVQVQMTMSAALVVPRAAEAFTEAQNVGLSAQASLRAQQQRPLADTGLAPV
jgi:hypothetical protein